MFGLLARILAGIGFATALNLQGGAWDSPASKLAAGWAAIAVVAYLAERRGLVNPGIAGWLAVVDSALLSYGLILAGLMPQYAFAVLAPLAYAAAHYGANPAAMAPLAVSSLFVVTNLAGGAWNHPVLLTQAAIALSVGLLMRVRAESIKTEARQITENLGELESVNELEDKLTTEYFELREKFRALRDHSRGLERRAKRGKLLEELTLEVIGAGSESLNLLAERIQKHLQVDGVLLYGVKPGNGIPYELTRVGAVPEAVETVGFASLQDLPVSVSQEDALRRLLALELPSVGFCPMVIARQGKPLGMLVAILGAKQSPDEVQESAEEVMGLIADLLANLEDREALRHRMNRAELLYGVSSTMQGGGSSARIAQRVGRDLWAMLPLDHLGIHLLDGEDSIVAATFGASGRLYDRLTFGSESGLTGWDKARYPEVYIEDAYESRSIDREEAFRQRVGCYLMIPMPEASAPVGFITASTHRVRRIDAASVETLRLVAAELGQVLRAKEARTPEPLGYATPGEIYEMAHRQSGSIVSLQVPRYEDLNQLHGRPAMVQALRSLALRLRTLLPPGAAVCRREEDDLLVFLPDLNGEDAERWANLATAQASMVAIQTRGGGRIPLAVRARLASDYRAPEVA